MTDDATFYVYLMSRLDGRPLYVGKGKGERWRHRGSYGRNKHLVSIMRQAKAQGTQLPCVKVWESLTEAKAFQCERALIAFFGRADKGEGLLVNLTDGGDGASGYRYSDEERAQHSVRMKARTMPPDWRANVSAGLKGKPKSPEHIAAAADALRGTKKSSGWWSTEEGRAKQRQNNHGGFKKGHQHSPESIEKIKAARAEQPKHISPATEFQKGYQPSPETRAKLSASITAAWARRKAAEGLKEI